MPGIRAAFSIGRGPDNVACVGDVDRTSVADRAWVHEAVRRVEADGNRSADTHLVRVPLWSFSDVDLYLGTLDDGREVMHALRPGRHAWLQVLRGAVDVGGTVLAAGDALAVSAEPALRMRAKGRAEVMLFDLV